MTFQFNPVAVRESRAMWRGARSFLLLLCYTGVLSIVAYLAYVSEVRNAASWAQYNGGEMQVQSARVGHTLFVALSFVQLASWLLIAPALSATAISSERERGLLESLLMSHLKPRQIIAGKLGVGASFVSLLILATLPILAMCFLLGGVSPGEFLSALAIQLATAFYALSLGIWCSASSRLSTHALGATFMFLVVWLFVTFLGAGYDSYSSHPMAQALRCFSLLNPLVGMNELLNSNTSEFRLFFLDASLRWPICVAFQVLVGARFLVLASRRVAGSLDEAEEPVKTPRRALRFSSSEAASAGAASTWDEASEGEMPAQLLARERDVYFEVPILKHIVFGGPLLRHYLRSSWRWKLPHGRSLKIWKLIALVFGVANLSAVRWMLNDPRYAPSSVIVFLLASCSLLIAVFVTACNGLSIARDRELGVWNHLRLSGISASEIALAKTFAPLLAALAYCALLIGPLFAVAYWVLSSNLEPEDWRWHEITQYRWFAPVWLLGVLQLSGWASICSLRAKRSTIALVASFAGALIFLVGVPTVWEISSSHDGDYYTMHRVTQHWLGLLHPFYTLFTAADLDSDTVLWRNPGLYMASLLTHAAFVLAFYRVVVAHVARRER